MSKVKIHILPFYVKNKNGGYTPYFVNTHKVLKVFECEKVLEAPDSDKPIHKVFNYEKKAIPVIVLNRLIGANQVENIKKENMIPRLLIVNIMDQTFGLIVDKTKKIIKLTENKIQVPHDSLKNAKSYVSGVYEDEESQYWYQFDIEQMLDDYSLIQMKKEIEQGSTTVRLDKAKVLIVEDSKLFQKLAAKILIQAGAQVEIAENGAEGLEKLAKNRYDLALVDIEMPILDGLEMVRQYRGSGKLQIPIIFHSSLSNEALVKDIYHEELGEFISKFDAETILKTIKELRVVGS